MCFVGRNDFQVVLNIVSGMVLVWFGPIANAGASPLLSSDMREPLTPAIVVDDFGFTLDQVNWFGNAVNVIYLPAAVVVPYLYGRLGLRGTVSATHDTVISQPKFTWLLVGLHRF